MKKKRINVQVLKAFKSNSMGGWGDDKRMCGNIVPKKGMCPFVPPTLSRQKEKKEREGKGGNW